MSDYGPAQAHGGLLGTFAKLFEVGRPNEKMLADFSTYFQDITAKFQSHISSLSRTVGIYSFYESQPTAAAGLVGTSCRTGPMHETYGVYGDRR